MTNEKKPAPKHPDEARLRAISDRRVFASLRGYFWLPCPRCGKWFNGAEATGDSVKIDGRNSRMACCMAGSVSVSKAVAEERILANKRAADALDRSYG